VFVLKAGPVEYPDDDLIQLSWTAHTAISQASASAR
jgi:hypothetical protein